MLDETKKDVILLGMRDEVLLVDMHYMDEREVELIIDFVHEIVWKELLSRTLQSMHDWSSRVNTMFIRHKIAIIKDLVVLTEEEVYYLGGCGYYTRKEIYDVCKSYGLILSSWIPEKHYDKGSKYVFKD